MNTVAMVLPDVDSQGYVRDAWVRSLGDARIPTPLGGRWGDAGDEVRATGSSARCVDEGPRHLWDILESATWREVEEGDEWYEEATFREVLTCVRCGRVEKREGTRRDSTYSRLDPEPLRAGALRAQEIERTHFFSSTGSSYVVVDEAGELVGRISWNTGQRGRRFYVGALGDINPRATTNVIEAPTAIGVLRKLARLHAATSRPVLGAAVPS